MKSLGPILTIVGSLLLAGCISLVGYEAYHAYMMNHTYYYTMLADSNNRKIIVWFILLAGIPLGMLLFSSSLSIKKLGRGVLGALLLSGFVHTTYKGGLVGSTGSFLFLFNMIVLIALILIFFGGLYAIGSKIYIQLFKNTIQNRSDILLSLGLGLGLFLLFNYTLLLVQAFYPIIAWIELGLLGYSIRHYKAIFQQTSNIINSTLKEFKTYDSNWKIIYNILIVVTLLYMMFGFNLSYIPYSTAWDANHAYMYFPKIRSLNNGVFFSEGPIIFPYLWMVYISYWFSLFKPLSNFTIAPDTLAVFMNSLSGRLSLLFGLGALKKVISFFQKSDENNDSSHIAFTLGWMYFLLWLMSGMGAFLVFVDNKTDLGVMSLTMLAIMSGFIFIEKVTSHINKDNLSLYGIISGLFFALAVMAKPTAFQDVLIFGLLLIGLWVGITGLLGGFLMVLGILGRAETLSMIFYINKSLATKFGIAGLLATIGQGIITFKKKSFERIKPLLYRSITIILLLTIFKGGYIATQQIISDTRDIKVLSKSILLGKNNTSHIKKTAFLADSGDTITIESLSGSTNIEPTIKPSLCTLSQSTLTKESLYSNLGVVKGGGLIEDFGRYIGFGQRTFSDYNSRPTEEKNNYSFVRLGYPLLKIFFHTTGCYSINNTADKLCENTSLGKSSEGINSLITQTDTESNQYKFLSGILDQYNLLKEEQDTNRQQSLQTDIQKSINDYVQGNVIEVKKDINNKISISIPYAYLTPLNVIFNWSLQNLSSYYTDIGFVWILSLLLLVAGFIYSIYQKEEKLLILHIVTICGWIIWWFIASGIIWYAVGIIARTLFCNALYLSNLLKESKTPIIQWSIRITLAVIIFTAIIQTILNSFRIASQGGSGPFTWYKGSTGKENIFIFNNQGIQQKEVVRTNYNAQDVFNMQFGHYNKFINYTQNRKNSDGVLVAGTYIQYFLQNQNNIISDGLLTEFWKWGSDENSCNLSLRLQDKKIKYLVIDPNIGSVVMGGGNASLFDRFVAKIDSKTNKIINHGTMTMLAKMIQEGYLKLIMTNNMGAKYAYTLPDNELESSIQSLPYEEIKNKLLTAFKNEPLLFRSKLAVPRFFGDESQHYFILIGAIFQQRLSQSIGLEDLSDILGKVTDNQKLLVALQTLKTPGANLTTLNKQLSEDERAVMGYYTAIDSRLKANDTKGAQEVITQLLQASLGGGSQLMTFELQI